MAKMHAIGAACIVVAMGVGVGGCGGSSKSASPPASSPKSISATTNDVVPAGSPGGGSGTDPCSLLTDDEVTAVIGDHAAGATGTLSGALYGDSGCVWKSNGARPDGLSDLVEVSVLTGDLATFARQQDAALGTPLASFGHNAMYQDSYARLWFDCGTGEYCHVHVDTAESTDHSGESRQDAAVKLANLVLDRV